MADACATAVDDPTPIDHYLAEQSTLTAVERFASRHATAQLSVAAGSYRDLLPASPPGPGQQYGFEVDLDACTGCKACVTACHSLNGLDEGESWRSVGLLHGGTPAEPRQQMVTTACHHCVEPACLTGCPVQAYDKDPATGIVSHLADQCFGCGYCTLTCPYEVPRLSRRRGIVRKCDLCKGRLEVGEAPACAQACPNRAITVGVVDTAAAVQGATGALVPGAPASALTVPTTAYRSRQGLHPDLRPADDLAVHPAQAHPPLAVMLVLTQLSVGAFGTHLALGGLVEGSLATALLPANAAVPLAVGVLALGASVLHLGRPRLAYRAVLGIRRSWLSREIVAFAVFALGAAAYAGLLVGVEDGSSARPVSVLGMATALAGGAGVACSVMIYAVTGRRWWRARLTTVRFALTTAVCGTATVLATSLVSGVAVGGEVGQRAVAEVVSPLAPLLMAATAAKLVWEAGVFRHLRAPELTELRRTALLLAGDLGAATKARFAAGTAGGILAPLALLGGPGPMAAAVVAVLGVLAVVAGELVERSQFFTAVAAPRMPGSLP